MEGMPRSLRSASASPNRQMDAKKKRALRSSGLPSDSDSSSSLALNESPSTKKQKFKREMKEDTTQNKDETEEECGEEECGVDEPLIASRPKRNIAPKNTENTLGLSWREEHQLQRALYASLHKKKYPERSSSEGDLQSLVTKRFNAVNTENNLSDSQDNSSGSRTAESSNSSCNGKKGGGDKLMLVMPGGSGSSENNTPSSADSLAASRLLLQKSQLRAQRKFAQGSRPCSPSTTPVKRREVGSPGRSQVDLRNCKAKTEDFLTFLCLRGTNFLPPHLAHFNYPESDDATSSCSGTPGTSSRPGTPANHRSRSAPTSRRQSPDRELISGVRNDLGVKPLPNSPRKKTKHKERKIFKEGKANKKKLGLFSMRKSKQLVPLRKIKGHRIRGPSLSQTASRLSSSAASLRRNRQSESIRLLRSRQTVNTQKAENDAEVDMETPDKSVQETTEADETMSSASKYQDFKMGIAMDCGVKVPVKRKLSMLKTQKGCDSTEIAEADSTTAAASKYKSDEIIVIDDSPDRSRADGSGKVSHDACSEQTKTHTGKSLKSSASTKSNGSHGEDSTQGGSTSIPTISLSFREYFPKPTDLPRIVQVPTYHPSAEQFVDPISYLELIRADAQSYGMCKIVPPEGWKPECKVSQELRFATQIQYIHKLMDRWGPNTQQFECIRHHLVSQGGNLDHAPVVGSLEVDLPGLSSAIQQCGGLQAVLDDNTWGKVAELLRHPRPIQEIQARLYEVYCRYLLSYDTLSTDEHGMLQQQVLADRQKQKRHGSLDTDCMAKGRTRTLSEFFRAARNMQAMFFKDGVEPSAAQVENEYWRLVEQGKHHVSVHAAHLDSSTHGSAFPTRRDSPYARHGWNFNMLHNNQENVLSHLTHIPGVTCPLLHIGMLFSTSCWSRDPHFLPTLHYTHTGADTIWYCVPQSEADKLKSAMTEVVSDLVDADQPIWLPEDSVMLSPSHLIEKGLSLCRAVQEQGQFMVVFPEAFTSNVSCGYNIAESINIAPLDWIPRGLEAAKLLCKSREPDLFSMDQLLISLAQHSSVTMLPTLLPHLKQLVARETRLRQEVMEAGVKCREKMSASDNCKKRAVYSTRQVHRCHTSQRVCYLSLGFNFIPAPQHITVNKELEVNNKRVAIVKCIHQTGRIMGCCLVVNETDSKIYCLEEGLRVAQRRKNLKHFKLVYKLHEKELASMLCRAEQRLAAHEGNKGPKLKKAVNA